MSHSVSVIRDDRRQLTDYKLIPEKMGLHKLKKIHCSSYMGAQRMQTLVSQSHIRIRDPNSKIAEIVKKQKQKQKEQKARTQSYSQKPRHRTGLEVHQQMNEWM